jgi:glycosyltransferase involved in cell wall biosynthesis
MTLASRKIRVLLLTDEMEVGGTQRQMVSIANHLDRHRFEPTVIFFRNSSFFVDELKQAGVQVIQIPKRGRLDLGFVWRLRQTLKREKFDVMQCFAFSGELWGAVAGRLLSPAQRPALISSVRGVYVWYARWQWRLKKWVSSHSQRVIANSRMGAQYACQEMGLPESAIHITYNGVRPAQPDTQAALALRIQLRVPSNGILVLFVGRLVEIKDVPTLLRAVARLHHQVPVLRVALAGDGPMREALTQQVAELALQSVVHFLGQREDVAELICAADIMVLPSLREGLSNVILEGMMGAKPVVASRAGGNVELIEHNRTGLLFDIGDDAGLACALDQLVNDGPLRAKLGQSALQYAQAQFGTEAMVHAYEKHYSEAFTDSLKKR